MAKKEKTKSWLFKQLKKIQTQLNQQIEEAKAEIPTSVPLSETVGTERYPDVHVELYPDKIKQYIQQDSGVTFHCKNGLVLKIALLSNTILRFRYASTGKFSKDFSYAIDPNFSPKETPYIFEEKKSKYIVQTNALICEVGKEHLNITLKDLKGKVINEDASRSYYHRSTILEGVREVKVTKKSPLHPLQNKYKKQHKPKRWWIHTSKIQSFRSSHKKYKPTKLNILSLLPELFSTYGKI